MFKREYNTCELDGGVVFKLPDDRSVLSILEINPVRHNDIFTKDGYVYNNNYKKRKWFVPLNTDYRLWEPKLLELELLENKVFIMTDKINKILKTLWIDLMDSFCDVKYCQGFDNQGFVRVEKSMYQGRPSIGAEHFRYKRNRKVVRQDLVNKYIHYIDRTSKLHRYSLLFKKTLEMSIFRKYREDIINFRSNSFECYKLPYLSINGRLYIFTNDHAGGFKINHPEDLYLLD